MGKIHKITLALMIFLAMPLMAHAADENPYASNNAAQTQSQAQSYRAGDSTQSAASGQLADGQVITDNSGNVIGKITQTAGSGIKTITDGAGNVIGTITGGVTSGVQTITNGAGKVIGTITSGVGSAVGKITDGLGNVIGGVTSGVGKAIGSVTNGLAGSLGSLFGGGGSTPTATAATFANMKSIDQMCDLQISKKNELKVISRSVKCFENMFMGIVEKKLIGMTDFLREAVFACLVLYVIFYGIKISTGIINEQRARGEFFIHALKIAFVSWMIMNYGILEMWYLTLDIYNGLLALVMVPTDLGACKNSMKSVPGLWESMDCIFSNFIGWNSGKAGWNGVPLVFGMFTSALNSGAGGGFIAMLVMMSIFSILMAMVRVAFIYILSMMTLILVFMISPIIIPLMLFPQTKEMFNGWWKVIISMVMQPVILFAYLSFMLGIFVEIIDGKDGLKEIYAQTQPHHEVGAVTNRGTDTGITSVFTMFDNSSGNIKLEAPLVFNLISVFVISYLLSSFTKFVASMGRELSGNSLSPDLSGSVPTFLQ